MREMFRRGMIKYAHEKAGGSCEGGKTEKEISAGQGWNEKGRRGKVQIRARTG